MKVCCYCKKEKKLSEFYPRYNRPGIRAECKDCTKKRKDENRRSNIIPAKAKLKDRFLGY